MKKSHTPPWPLLWCLPCVPGCDLRVVGRGVLKSQQKKLRESVYSRETRGRGEEKGLVHSVLQADKRGQQGSPVEPAWEAVGTAGEPALAASELFPSVCTQAD